MKYLIASLCLVLFAHQAVAEQVPTGNGLVRLVCQQYTETDGPEPRTRFFNHVLILEQTSSRNLNTETALSDTTDGSELIDPEHARYFTDETAFRLRVYKASLVSDRHTKAQNVGELLSGDVGDLLSREADRDQSNRLMDFTGIGFRVGTVLVFKHEGVFLKKVEIDMEDFRGFMNTNLSAANPYEDGFYACRKPVLVPEMVDEENG